MNPVASIVVVDGDVRRPALERFCQKENDTIPRKVERPKMNIKRNPLEMVSIKMQPELGQL